MNKFTLLGDRVLIKLDEHPDHTVTASGHVIPSYKSLYSEAGRPKEELSSQRHLYQGTVIALSPLAASKLEEEKTPLVPNDRVYVSQQTNAQHYQFFLDRSGIALSFDGHIAIPHTLIEAKINGN